VLQENPNRFWPRRQRLLLQVLENKM